MHSASERANRHHYFTRMTRITHLLLALVLAAVALVGSAPPALADAAGPTDYRTDIVSVEPATPAIRVTMIGGDAFLRLEQLQPVEVIVLGYQAEPYLRFDPDGTVFENRRSPAVWLNQERYGTEQQLPAFASADARPEWLEVAENGSYSWHDHRSHWMNPLQPPGAEPGDQVLEATVPLDIDGERVVITVASYLLDPPSILPAVIGAVAAVALGAALWRTERLPRMVLGLLLAGGTALLGVLAYRAVPAETEPSTLLWMLPAVAAASTLTVVLVRNRVATTVYLDGLAVVAGATLAGWGFTRLDALRRALIPSDAPASLDRIGITIALLSGTALGLHGLYGLMNPERLEPAGVTETTAHS